MFTRYFKEIGVPGPSPRPVIGSLGLLRKYNVSLILLCCAQMFSLSLCVCVSVPCECAYVDSCSQAFNAYVMLGNIYVLWIILFYSIFFSIIICSSTYSEYIWTRYDVIQAHCYGADT